MCHSLLGGLLHEASLGTEGSRGKGSREAHKDERDDGFSPSTSIIHLFFFTFLVTSYDNLLIVAFW